MIVNNITDLIGNTPLLKIDPSIHSIKNLNVYAKLELFNPLGSVKDRTALGLLSSQINELQNGKKVIESSSSNTAKALQIISVLNKSQTKVITNRIKVPEQKAVLQLIGTEVEELPGKSECYDPNDPNDPIRYIENEINKNPNKYIYTDQYKNLDNYNIHYNGTGKEISQDLPKVDFVFGGLGTTGSIMGISEALKKENKKLKPIGIVSEKDDFIPGIRNIDEVLEVGLFDPSYYKKIMTIDSKKAIDYSLVLIRKQGLLAGPTTGASLAGIIDYFKNNPPKDTTNVVFIACDRAENYISYYKERRPEIFGLGKITSWQDSVKIMNNAEIDSEKLNNLIKQKSDPILLIDIRNPVSFKAGHITGSMNLPFDTLDPLLNDTNAFCKNHKIIFVCAIGEKSKLIASYLQSKGIDSYSLKDGINDWRDSNYDLENDL